jgi:exonuclease SbcD
VRVIGGVVRNAAGQLVTEDLLVPLRNAAGEVCALCVAIPFLRSSDVMALVPPRTPEPAAASQGEYVMPRPGEAPAESEADPLEIDPLIGGMRTLHGELFAAARAAMAPGQALVVMAHGYLRGCAQRAQRTQCSVAPARAAARPVSADCAYGARTPAPPAGARGARPRALAGRRSR